MSKSAIIQFGAGLLLGGAFLWVLNQYGWQSSQALWAALGSVLLLVAVNLSDLRTRIAQLEKQIGSRK